MNEHITYLLMEKEIKPSYQRIKVMETLNHRKDHPTVEQIYSALKPELPTLSKATVYNTLKLFEEKKLLKAITIEDNEVRYDAIILDHGHFKCEDCGAIYDFPVRLADLDHGTLGHFHIRQRDVFFKGHCVDCRK
jgi:Fe2+ or Zn2+ uptake regulation protein